MRLVFLTLPDLDTNCELPVLIPHSLRMQLGYCALGHARQRRGDSTYAIIELLTAKDECSEMKPGAPACGSAIAET